LSACKPLERLTLEPDELDDELVELLPQAVATSASAARPDTVR
jgi:hypothetical protein